MSKLHTLNSTNSIKLSIVYTNYNGFLYLKSCLEPIISMLTDECELIIVDDGSSDESREALKKYAKIKNVQLIFKEHSGVSSTRNIGLAWAQGEYITFIDGDDTLYPNILSALLNHIKSKADLYIFGIERTDMLLNTSQCSALDNHLYESASEFADCYIRNHKYLIYSASNKLYKREIITENKIFFNESLDFGEDRIFNYDYLYHCQLIYTSSDIMLRYHNWHVPSASTKYIENYRELVLYLHKKKIDCFLSLTKGTTVEEQKAFEEYDYQQELKRVTEHELSHSIE